MRGEVVGTVSHRGGESLQMKLLRGGGGGGSCDTVLVGNTVQRRRAKPTHTHTRAASQRCLVLQHLLKSA